MGKMAKVFELNRKGLNVPRGLIAVGIFLLPLIVLIAVHQEQYFLSVSLGAVLTPAGISATGRHAWRWSGWAVRC
jgi:hypothetical protein